jgi:hypothetical protein
MSTSTLKLKGLKKKKTGGSKKNYPTLPDPEGKVAEKVANLCDLKAKIDQYQGSYDILEGDLKSRARQFIFSRREAPGTVKAFADSGAGVSLSVKNQYYPISTTDAEDNDNPRVVALRKVMGKRFDQVMDTGVTVEINMEKVPEELRQEMIDALVGIANMYDAEEAVTAKEFVKPKKSFHLDRCELFTEEENHEINRHLPVTISLNAKGVSK